MEGSQLEVFTPYVRIVFYFCALILLFTVSVITGVPDSTFFVRSSCYLLSEPLFPHLDRKKSLKNTHRFKFGLQATLGWLL